MSFTKAKENNMTKIVEILYKKYEFMNYKRKSNLNLIRFKIATLSILVLYRILLY
jgi:hypothetical protein